MKPLLITFCFFLLVKTSLCQQNYDAASIPKELLSHASAVIRDEESVVTVEDLDNTLFHYKLAVTILNKNGDDQARIEIEHDKSTVIKYVKGAIYNEFGKQIGKFSESDFEEDVFDEEEFQEPSPSG